MLINNGRMIMDRIVKPLQLRNRIRSAPAAVLLGSCVLLFGSQLYAQDLLLKEYIYLDGRLLAVERQVLPQIPQRTEGGSGKQMESAQCPACATHGLIPPGGNDKPVLSGIPGMQETREFHSPVFVGLIYPDRAQTRLAGNEGFKPQEGGYRGHWRIAGILEHENGGSDDGQ